MNFDHSNCVRVLRLLCIMLVFVAAGSTAVADPVPTPTVEELKLELSFQQAVQFAAQGEHMKAYGVARNGRTLATESKTVIPEKYSALVTILARNGLEQTTQLVRVMYLSGKWTIALELANASLIVAKEESLEVPETLARIHRNIEKGNLDLFLFIFPSRAERPFI